MQAEASPLPDGYLQDFVSGKVIRATPEEVEAVQILAERLVEDFGYLKAQIQTRPQFRVKASPSGHEKYPVDIAVFRHARKLYDDVYIVCECKRKRRRDGIKQLKIYLGLCPATLGIWFNGEEHAYIRKIVKPDGTVEWDENFPSIPRAGEPLESVGRRRRRDLIKPTKNFKAVFRDIRNHLAGMVTGITRDEQFAQEFINLLFCKIYDEHHTAPEEYLWFTAGVEEGAEAVRDRIVRRFRQDVRDYYDHVFDGTEDITLDAESIKYIVGELQDYCLSDADRFAVADAFEIFISKALKGSQGQFFTPRNVVKMMVDILDPDPRESIIDPACGSGGFLIAALGTVWDKLEAQARKKGWKEAELAREKSRLVERYFRGIEKDEFLAKVSRAYMAIVGDGSSKIFCDNSLKDPDEWKAETQHDIALGSFDVVVTNPPFGSKIKVEGRELLGQYELARKWERDRKSDEWEMTSRLQGSKPPQVLFLERCLQLLKPGGRLGIVLPESMFGNPSHSYIMQWLRERATIFGVVSMPEELFQPYTHAKTCVVFVRNEPPPRDYRIFMAVVKWCGHESRGREIPYDDVPDVAVRYRELRSRKTDGHDRRGFVKRSGEIAENIMIPKYYDPELKDEIASLSRSHDLVTIQELVDDDVLRIDTGHEVGKLNYGTGDVPFIRTSDIANWELKIDPKQGLDETIYEKYRKKQRIEPRDILLVRDGTYLIGTTAILTEHDSRIIFQSHIYRLKVVDQEKLDPYLLLAMLNAPIVKKQIRSKQFTQDIIDTLGRRLYELVLPIPKDKKNRARIAAKTRRVVEGRAALRQEAKQVALEVVGKAELSPEEKKDLVEAI